MVEPLSWLVGSVFVHRHRLGSGLLVYLLEGLWPTRRDWSGIRLPPADDAFAGTDSLSRYLRDALPGALQ